MDLQTGHVEWPDRQRLPDCFSGLQTALASRSASRPRRSASRRSALSGRERRVDGGGELRVSVIRVALEADASFGREVDRPVHYQDRHRLAEQDRFRLACRKNLIDRLRVPVLFIVQEKLRELEGSLDAHATRAESPLLLLEKSLARRVVEIYQIWIRKHDLDPTERVVRTGLL